jgi:hypothetical protein
MSGIGNLIDSVGCGTQYELLKVSALFTIPTGEVQKDISWNGSMENGKGVYTTLMFK